MVKQKTIRKVTIKQEIHFDQYFHRRNASIFPHSFALLKKPKITASRNNLAQNFAHQCLQLLLRLLKSFAPNISSYMRSMHSYESLSSERAFVAYFSRKRPSSLRLQAGTISYVTYQCWLHFWHSYFTSIVPCVKTPKFRICSA